MKVLLMKVVTVLLMKVVIVSCDSLRPKNSHKQARLTLSHLIIPLLFNKPSLCSGSCNDFNSAKSAQSGLSAKSAQSA